MNQNNIVQSLLSYGKNYLKQNRIATAVIDAEIILMYVLNFSKVQLFSHNRDCVAEDEHIRYLNMLQMRADGIPVQYIVGKQEFMSIEFDVNSHTLIPRADTEILVEAVLEKSKSHNLKYILDIGTGSGCIPISILYYNSDMNAVAIDIDEAALYIAKNNALKNRVSDRIEFINSNLFENLNSSYKFDAIVSNPPYIMSSDIKNLMKEVQNEPLTALDGGHDGLCFYRDITYRAYEYIEAGGFLFYEVGYNQSNLVSAIMKDAGFENIEIIDDLASIPRVVVGNKKLR